MAKAYGYVRVSTQGQADDGVSLDAQRAKIAAWADLNGYELGDTFEDAGISGTKTDRPGLAAALAAVGKGDALVVYSLSRLARSTKHTIEISEHLDKVGADLVSLSERIDTTTAAGKMIFRMLAVMAEFERDQTSERTVTALQYKKSKGQKTGGAVPYGFDLGEDGIHLSENEAEQAVIREARELHQSGLSLRKIAAELNARGLVARNGRAFQATQIMRMVA